MSIIMAKSKKQDVAHEGEKKKANRSGLPLNSVIDADVRQQLDAYIDSYSDHPRPATIRSTIEASLKQFLAKEGFWPPKAD